MSETATGYAETNCSVCGAKFKYRIGSDPVFYWCRPCLNCVLKGTTDEKRAQLVEAHLNALAHARAPETPPNPSE